MTRKDYIVIANIIKWNKTYKPNPDIVHEPVDTVLERVASSLASAMALDNDRFDHKKFMAACGF